MTKKRCPSLRPLTIIINYCNDIIGECYYFPWQLASVTSVSSSINSAKNMAKEAVEHWTNEFSCKFVKNNSQRGTQTMAVSKENISCVTRPYGVTILPFELTLKFVYLKFQQKYEWIEHTSIYHHAKFEIEKKIVQEETKKRNLHLNSSGLQLCVADPLALLFTRRFHFFVASCTKFRCISNFAWWWKMTWTIHLYFCWNFKCTNLDVIRVGNTITL